MKQKQKLFKNLKWLDFKTCPPHDYRTSSTMEDDPDRGYFTFRYTHRPGNKSIYLSYAACSFIDGIFAEYKSHMKTYPYPEDWIEVLTWCPIKNIHHELLESAGANYV